MHGSFSIMKFPSVTINQALAPETEIKGLWLTALKIISQINEAAQIIICLSWSLNILPLSKKLPNISYSLPPTISIAFEKYMAKYKMIIALL